MFDSLRRWTKAPAPTAELPVPSTIDAMDQAGVSTMLISVWYAPGKEMISNDEVARLAAEAPGRLIGVWCITEPGF